MDTRDTQSAPPADDQQTPPPPPGAAGRPAHMWGPGEASAHAAAAAKRGADAEAALAIRGLRKSFRGRRVLEGVDLAVARGELVAVLGANGSGKSTALRCVVGLVEPEAGSIKITGHEVVGSRGRSLTAARRDAAMIFQQIHLVKRRNAIDNV